jgi:uncharacterized Zn finger protein
MTLLLAAPYSDNMGKLMDKLRQKCPVCKLHEIPRRLRGRFIDYDSERVYLLHCRKCGFFWLDPSVKKLKPYRLKGIYLHPSMDEEE